MSQSPFESASPQTKRRVKAMEDAIRACNDALADLDSAATAAGLSARLMLPELASTFDGPSGLVVHIPVHITKREGGRVSLFKLAPGETATVGVYVIGGRAYDRKVMRVSGTGPLAKGDRLAEQIVDAEAAVVQSLVYEVKSINIEDGSAIFSNVQDDEIGDFVINQAGMCWFCNAGSGWWCGLPCLNF
ncbi:hypothetical protein SAMN05216386_1693 [Nitrosospira briensis]|uniref:Uncharacterized protein n=1 Tax=Nitrosospira briensis TaxID=35799 RepID=A0A1I5BJA2_9PROT|nr:hypothetical protein [Nitrosospira briensis]SFN74732.1 hypothetical protein SAMN05216386_1693 [Nitrosospira briensis]